MESAAQFLLGILNSFYKCQKYMNTYGSSSLELIFNQAYYSNIEHLMISNSVDLN